MLRIIIARARMACTTVLKAQPCHRFLHILHRKQECYHLCMELDGQRLGIY